MRPSLGRPLPQVSISGQALVFVVRTVSHSFLNKAGRATYLAFLFAQTASSLIAIFGFNGYESPRDGIKDCRLCTLAHADESVGGNIPFWSAREAPTAGTEGAFTASVLGCTYWVVVAWVWSAIWYIGLDPIKVRGQGVEWVEKEDSERGGWRLVALLLG